MKIFRSDITVSQATPDVFAQRIIDLSADFVIVEGARQTVSEELGILSDSYCPSNQERLIYPDNFLLQVAEQLEIKDQEYYWAWSKQKDLADQESGIGIFSKNPLIAKETESTLQAITELVGKLVLVVYADHMLTEFDLAELAGVKYPLFFISPENTVADLVKEIFQLESVSTNQSSQTLFFTRELLPGIAVVEEI